MAAFDCCGTVGEGDEIAEDVRDFLRDGRAVSGIEHGISSTYLYLDLDETPPTLLGYATIASASVKLSNSEKDAIGHLPSRDLPALRLVMLGCKHDLQRQGIGSRLLEGVVGIAREVREFAAVRFLLADVNPAKKAWYEARQFVVNKSPTEQERGQRNHTVSMRLDLGPFPTPDAPPAQPD